MARTSTRGWKGCQMCKPHKNRAEPDAVRLPWAVVKKMGKKRRVSRHDIPRED